MKRIIGLLLILLGIFLGLWLGVWVLFIGGLVQIITEIRAEEFDAMVVAYGVLKMISATLVGIVCALVLIIPGTALISED